jgi:tetratricopeptide (TPR) repeat protein
MFVHLAVDEVNARQLHVLPVGIPKTLKDRGYTPESLAIRIATQMHDLTAKANSTIPHELITSGGDKDLEIRLPGQEVSYKVAVDLLKQLFHIEDVELSVNILETSRSLEARVRIEGGAIGERNIVVVQDSMSVDDFIDEIGRRVTRIAQPNMLASHMVRAVEEKGCSLAACDFHEADEIYDEVVTSSRLDESALAWAGKGDLLIIRGKWKEAERLSETALAIYEDSAALHQIHAVALEHKGSVRDAIAELQRAVTLTSATADTWRILGDVLMHTHASQNYHDALVAFRQGARMKSDFTDNLHDWAEALMQTGDYDSAINVLSRATRQDPTNVPSYIELGRALDCKGDVRSAAHEYGKAYQLNPKHLQAERYFVAALLELNQSLESADLPATKPESARRLLSKIEGEGEPVGRAGDRCRGPATGLTAQINDDRWRSVGPDFT